MTPHGYIYGLFDPRDEALRYVGQTTTSPKERLVAHLCPSSLGRHSHAARWLKGLVDRGLRPLVLQLDVAWSQDELDRLERGWIAKCLAEGRRLTNLTAGGAGCWGRTVSSETRAKISRSQKGVPRPKHSEVTKKKMSASHRANPTVLPPDHYEALAASKRGVACPPEVRAKISATKQVNPSRHRRGAQHSEATKAQISKSRQGKHQGQKHHNFRRDISTEFILQRLAEGASKASIAQELGVHRTLVFRRINQARKAGLEIPGRAA